MCKFKLINGKTLISFVLLLSLIFTSRAFAELAESESTLPSKEVEVVEETSDLIETTG